MKLFLLSIAASAFMFKGCFGDHKVEVTTAYIINDHWENQSSSFFGLERMTVKKDSSLNIFDPNFRKYANNINIVDKLELDTAYVYNYNSGESSILDDTVFFNGSNLGRWSRVSKVLLGSTIRLEAPGTLKFRTWYRFSELRDRRFFVYVYVDSTGKTHSFEQDLSSY